MASLNIDLPEHVLKYSFKNPFYYTLSREHLILECGERASSGKCINVTGNYFSHAAFIALFLQVYMETTIDISTVLSPKAM